MKRKLVSMLVVLMLGVGYCKPPEPQCTEIIQKPGECRGFIAPSVPGR